MAPTRTVTELIAALREQATLLEELREIVGVDGIISPEETPLLHTELKALEETTERFEQVKRELLDEQC